MHALIDAVDLAAQFGKGRAGRAGSFPQSQSVFGRFRACHRIGAGALNSKENIDWRASGTLSKPFPIFSFATLAGAGRAGGRPGRAYGRDDKPSLGASCRIGCGRPTIRIRRSRDLPPDQPLKLDAGVELAPFQVAYQTYGTLNAERSNAVLICHALTGDQHVFNRHPVTGKPGWWETMIGPGKPIDTERYFVICPNVLGACMGTTGPASTDPAHRRALGPRFPGHHRPRHGAGPGDAARPSRHRHAVCGGRRLDGRHAGAAMGRELSGAGVRGAADRLRDPPFGPEHRLPRGRPPGGDGRPRLARRPLFRRRREPAARPRGGAHGRAHHLSVGRGAAPQIRPQVPGPRQSDLLLRRRFRGRELPAPPGLVLRRALRRQQLSLPDPRDGLFRPRGRLWRRARQRLQGHARRGSA